MMVVSDNSKLIICEYNGVECYRCRTFSIKTLLIIECKHRNQVPKADN